MKNGKHTPANLDSLAALLRKNNRLLSEQLSQLIFINSSLQVIMGFLPCCSTSDSVKKEVGMRLVRAWNLAEKQIRKDVSKRLKKH